MSIARVSALLELRTGLNMNPIQQASNYDKTK